MATHYFRWLGYTYPRAFKVAHHIANEGKRSIAGGARLKAQGLKAGIPDIHIPIGLKGYHSLYIELKVPPNKLTDSQVSMKKNLELEGNLCYVCYSLDEAMKVTTDYMEEL